MGKLVLSIVMLLTVSILFGQELPSIIPPSPNAASLAQYADVPVSKYTGIPSLSIPLYTLKSGKIELPLSINYHASGVKVAQEASWVGLGWSLNAGGNITRQVRGVDDFEPRGFPYVDEYNPSELNGFEFFEKYKLDNPSDTEPDIFYYNFFGYTGKFFFEKQTANGHIIYATPIDQNQLIISYNIHTKEWIVTDGNGWKYYLGNKNLNVIERTLNAGSSRFVPITSDRLVFGNKLIDTAWYLTKVLTPEGDEMKFLYKEGHFTSLSQVSHRQELYELYGSVGDGGQLKYFASQQVTYDVYLSQIICNNGIASFSTSHRADMRVADGSSIGPKRLSHITIKDSNLNSKTIKEFEFQHSYFNQSKLGTDNEHDYLRLKLDAVQEKSGNSELPPYEFYYNTTALPDKGSYSVDYWGFFNGANNNLSTLTTNRERLNIDEYLGSNTPFLTYNKPRAQRDAVRTLIPSTNRLGGGRNLGGANRFSNPSYVKSAILERIKYPTGAQKDFTYEVNEFENDLGETLGAIDGGHPLRVTKSVTDYGSDTPASSKQTTFWIFNIPPYHIQKVHLDVNISNGTWYNINDFSIFDDIEVVLENSHTGKKIISFKPDSLERMKSGGFYTQVEITLPAGFYRMRVNNAEHDRIPLTMTVKYLDPFKYFPPGPPDFHKPGKIPEEIDKSSPDKIGAGVRIKTIKTKDASGLISEENYSYDDELGITTGLLMTKVINHYHSTNYRLYNTLNLPPITISKNYLVRTSGSVVAMGSSAQGNPVGYSKVKVTHTGTVEGSSFFSEYFYNNKPSVVREEVYLSGVPYFAPYSNGQLLKEKHYNSLGKLVSEKSFKYSQREQSKISIEVGILDIGYFRDLLNPPNSLDHIPSSYIGYAPYHIRSEWWHLDKEKGTIYDVNGNNPVANVTNYIYHSEIHKLPTEINTTNSKGEVLKTLNSYPSDKPTGVGIPSLVYNKMVEQNILSPVIKQETFKNDVLLTTKANVFNNWDNVILPKSVKTGKGTNDLEDRIEFVKYNNTGKILEVKRTNGAPTCYIWGYKGEYPIAKLDGVHYSAISTSIISNLQTLSNADDDRTVDIINSNGLITKVGKEGSLREALRNLRNSLPNAMVTTYTYDPLIGVTSLTDSKGYTTYYDYDEFNRLEFVKDADGNLMSENKYNYKN
ncbi:RHS repeat domain-containing protein [Flavivirga eckloniae]|uniref:Sugar-binding protein n=1 Tax=Flavivirga eckloniae TaxID=1803846 RepID=A0A2K9PPM5_9FLAO|nr:RHS repeat domain-containing protein [Flavivirga eckloniae]AUP78995.1 hypothetical protein C1H87_09900 [Flavivirga eckloniae]